MIVTNVPNNLNRPQTFHWFNYIRSAGALANVPLSIALIGTMGSGTATAGTVYQVTDAVQSDALFGVGSELALMCRMAYACSALFGRGPRVFAVGVVEPGAGTANVKTLTVVGTATSDGNIPVRVAGRTFQVGVRKDDGQNTIATAISNALKAGAATLPVVPSVATNVVTLTHPHKGVNGKDVALSVDGVVPGVTVTPANTVVGAGVADHQPALDALSPMRYEGIVFANHAAADIAEIVSDITGRWAAASKTWGWYFIGEMGSMGTATALAAAVNHQSAIITNIEGCLNTAGEIATASAMLAFSRERPNANYDGAKVPLYPPPAATLYTGPEVEAAILAGLTVYTGVKDSTGAIVQDRMRCERMVTSKTTTNNQPDDKNRDLAVSRTGVALAIQLDIASEEALGADNNPDGVIQDTDTDKQIKDLAAAIMRSFAEDRILVREAVEADISGIVVEHDSVTQGRNNVKLPYTVAMPLHQVAWAHYARIGA